MNHKRGAQSVFEGLPGGAVPPMPLEVATTLAMLGGALSSYYLGMRR